MTVNLTGYYGTTTAPIGGQYVAPNTCPGYGRCRDCGRPYEAAPYNPYTPPWPTMPYIGDVPGWMERGPICGIGTITAAGNAGE